jgi:arabinose-5-phosphate isomerase
MGALVENIENMHDNMDYTNGLQVLKEEIAGLEALASSLDGQFIEAVAAIDAMRNSRSGRLIIAGIGKSGHVCRKMAATMASTGTPSYYVHPGEASHGDLGMVTENDVVLMLSNSGENPELSDLIHYTRRFGITLIAMTANGESTLARYADIKLVYPKLKEACPNNMAPTTSTTMMMAYGDALAVALLKRSGLTKEQFRVFHPGGKLGKQLLKVSDLMNTGDELPVLDVDATMDKALLMMTEKNLGSVLCVDQQNKLLGILTDGDLKRHMGPDLLAKKLGDLISTTPKSISEDALAAEAMDIMLNKQSSIITALVVLDDNGHLKGLIRLQECLRAGLA